MTRCRKRKEKKTSVGGLAFSVVIEYAVFIRLGIEATENAYKCREAQNVRLECAVDANRQYFPKLKKNIAVAQPNHASFELAHACEGGKRATIA